MMTVFYFYTIFYFIEILITTGLFLIKVEAFKTDIIYLKNNNSWSSLIRKRMLLPTFRGWLDFSTILDLIITINVTNRQEKTNKNIKHFTL